ncbi:MAG: SGNH hydrolase domain-containing protein, partial [Dermabacter sp.]|nr:SGNH hydrolase domain-containing protein [Dermabacter sp.]
DASTASPLQHFWSLSLQGQVFLTWPLLFIAAKFAARKSAHPRRVAFGFFSVIATASFVFSIYYTATHQSAAYFSTPARAWEVACGTLLALALPTLDRLLGSARPGSPEAPRHRTLRALAGWAGFALLVSLGIVLNVQGLFPGWIALWPLTGAGLIIVAGYSGTSWGFDRVLTMKLPRALASSSYSLYLVHWPILILWLAHSGQKRAGALDGLIVILGSMALAWVLSTIVDSHFRKPAWKTAPWWRSLTVIGTCLALVLGGALGLRGYLASQQTSAPITAGATENSNALTAAFNPDTLSPKGFELDGQWPNLPHLCDDPSEVLVATKDIPCETLRPLGSKASATVLVVGSSHSRQFIPTILDEAKAKNWQIINFTKNACPFREDSMLGDGEYCKGYYDQVMKAIDTHHPDLVL